MKYSSIDDLASLEKNIVLTFGNFDGLHLGHQHLLTKAKVIAKKHGAEVVVVTFEPHPRELLARESGFLLNLPDERYLLLEEYGIKHVVEFPFDFGVSNLKAEQFCSLFAAMNGLKAVVVGHDFSLGRNKSGTYEIISKFFREIGVESFLSEEFKFDGLIVSSSLIRELLKNGVVEEAAKLLGRNFYFNGSVIHGDKRGRKIGFHTANLSVSPRVLTPGPGVYLTKVKLNDVWYNSLTNIGFVPTFKTNLGKSIETHILDFEKIIYGEVITVSFVKRLRDEQKFDSREALIKQINKDIEEAKRHFLR